MTEEINGSQTPGTDDQQAPPALAPVTHCQGTKRDGKPCGSTRLVKGTQFCYPHLPKDHPLKQKRGGPITDEPEPESFDATRPWQPASILHVTNKDKNYTYYWCRTDLLEKKLAEGWETVKSKAGAEAPKRTLMDGTKLTGLVQKRNLILVRMHMSRKEAREKYFAGLTDDNVGRSVKELENASYDPDKQEQMAYGEVKIKVG